jgi:mono/diheme cytochrome c family protein
VLVAAGAAWFGTIQVAAQQKTEVAVPAGGRGDVEHGRYLVESVAMCAECHSTRDQAGIIVPTTRLYGGPLPIKVPWPADWPIAAPRIAGLPAYTDAEFLRLLTEGGAMKRNGAQARAPMPRFRMSAQDAADVAAYLRTK